MWPNPASGSARVEVASGEAVAVEVVDARGRRVARVASGRWSGGRTLSLPLADFAPGAYAVRVVSADGSVASRPFVVVGRD